MTQNKYCLKLLIYNGSEKDEYSTDLYIFQISSYFTSYIDLYFISSIKMILLCMWTQSDK